jgi:NitT/TauT family transport system substrate-binding protein
MLLGHAHIESLESIAGCRIGVEPESVDGLSVYLALSSAGLTLEDVTLVPLAQSEMVEAMQSGQVDAVQSYPPTSDAILDQPGVHRLWDSSRAPTTILDVLAVRDSLLAQQPEAVAALVAAYGRAQEYFRLHEAEATAILARRCGLSRAALRRSLRGMRLLGPEDPEAQAIFDPAVHRALTQRVASGLMSIGMLRRLPEQSPFVAGLGELTVP